MSKADPGIAATPSDSADFSFIHLFVDQKYLQNITKMLVKIKGYKKF